MNKKEFFKQRIDKIAKESFNADQKELAKKIIDNTEDKDLDAVWGFISQRVKTGFVFDEAPEINHDCVAYIKENEKLGINVGKENTVEHSLIIGENYDALKNLVATYTDKQGNGLIDIIYIDPPYNTDKSKEEGNDYKENIEGKSKFIYRDKYTRDGWLNMMNERLKLAKKLLKDDGFILISINDTEQAYLRVLCDDIFGEENFIENFIWVKNSGGSLSKTTLTRHEHIICFAKNKEKSYESTFYLMEKPGYKDVIKIIEKCKGEGKNTTQAQEILNRFYREHPELKGISLYSNIDSNYRVYRTLPITAPNNLFYDVLHPITRKPVQTPPRGWSWSMETMDKNIKEGRVIFGKDETYGIAQKLLLDDAKFEHKRSTFLCDQAEGNKILQAIFGAVNIFENPKPISLLYFLLQNTSKSSIILDFFAGSGTTGQAVMGLNEEDGGKRKFILVTNNENNIATKITRERLYRVINGKGSKGEELEWTYSKDKKCLNNNALRVFNIVKENLNITDIDKAEKIKKEAESNFIKLNPNYNTKSDLDIYNVLSSLTPYKDESED